MLAQEKNARDAFDERLRGRIVGRADNYMYKNRYIKGEIWEPQAYDNSAEFWLNTREEACVGET